MTVAIPLAASTVHPRAASCTTETDSPVVQFPRLTVDDRRCTWPAGAPAACRMAENDIELSGSDSLIPRLRPTRSAPN